MRGEQDGGVSSLFASITTASSLVFAWLSMSVLTFAYLRRAVPRTLHVRQLQSRPDTAALMFMVGRSCWCLCDSNFVRRFVGSDAAAGDGLRGYGGGVEGV